ncbi:SOS response-associated peptidase [Thiohalorhabdus sp. Cl-TMA]|uniref:Abasic site processing protein n=1 Tax=Thiohalorhabdus methylotrophus TaxID=3242694 RepID=A0ABV4TYI1_9GAMM
MCGRYGLFTPEEDLAELFRARIRDTDWRPSYNLAPSQTGMVCREPEAGQRELSALEWGLIPFWAKDPRETRSKYSLINARAESVAEKASFKAAFKYRRCLIPADGFYEWHTEGTGPKQPYWIRFRSGNPMSFAGLWERWEGTLDGERRTLETYTIIVGPPNELLGRIHYRMPVILGQEDWDIWLDPGMKETEALRQLLQPYPADGMEAYPVSRRVNNPKNDQPELLEATEEG